MEYFLNTGGLNLIVKSCQLCDSVDNVPLVHVFKVIIG